MEANGSDPNGNEVTMSISKMEGWGFVLLMGCLITTTLSLTLLSGGWQIAGSLAAVGMGILSGGFYAASVRPEQAAKALPEG